MPDPRFFETLAPLDLARAAALTHATLLSGDQDAILTHVATCDTSALTPECADTEAIIYAEEKKTLESIGERKFGLCLTTEALAPQAPTGGAVAVTKSPRESFAILAGALHRSHKSDQRAAPADFKGAFIDHTAVIDATAQIGAGARIGPHVFVGPGVVIGACATLGAGVSLTHSIVGENARILAGAAIGQAGFGFVQTADGLLRVPQLGRVVIGDHVEIGANSTIDRGALGDTVIGDGTKIDNLVQIGHNVRIGRNCVLAAQAGLSGSCVIGEGVFMGGQVGLSDHLTIGDGAQLAAGTGLMRDVPAGEKWGGRPGRLAKDWLREVSALKKLAKKRNG